ncbi:MAG: NAD(+)/NADH kinase [Armatimonadota bacterium]|nr:MAG: NAD(+)/NADH kinase [Armatimonadota bacterium]
MHSASSPPSKRAAFDPGSVRCVGIVPALHKRRIAAAVNDVIEWFGRRGIRTILPEEQALALSAPELTAELSHFAEQADLLLAMGGDGTFLTAARLGAPEGKATLGINLGGFGFLAAIPSGAKMLDGLGEVMDGHFRTQHRMMLQGHVTRREQQVSSFLALNDIVVGKGAFSRLFRLKTSISDEPISDFPADGIIVATPTGSTGYSLSAGGPVIDPETRLIIVTPICAHTLSARTLVVPASRVVEIALPDPRSEEVNLTADGQEGHPLQAGDRVEVREAPFSAQIVALEDASFYAKLRSKLGWGSHR